MESIKNLSIHLTETELKSFSSNNYYYLTTIYYMGKPNFSQVAEALKLTKPAISVFVNKLSRMGLIEKVKSEGDKRVYYICITQKGKNIIEGDDKLYSEFDLLIKNLVIDNEKYEFVESLLAKVVRSLN